MRRRVAGLAKALDASDAVSRCAGMVADRLAARRVALHDAAQSAGAVYAPGPLHDLRIALKKHRYAMEIAAELLRSRGKRALTRSKHLQDVLGELHDLVVLAARVQDYRSAARRRPLTTVLKRLADHLDGRLRTLHLDYLARRGDLAFILEQSERAVRAIRLAQAERSASASAPAAPAEGSAP
jgi:CHAD domain-containing protein